MRQNQFVAHTQPQPRAVLQLLMIAQIFSIPTFLHHLPHYVHSVRVVGMGLVYPNHVYAHHVVAQQKHLTYARMVRVRNLPNFVTAMLVAHLIRHFFVKSPLGV